MHPRSVNPFWLHLIAFGLPTFSWFNLDLQSDTHILTGAKTVTWPIARGEYNPVDGFVMCTYINFFFFFILIDWTAIGREHCDSRILMSIFNFRNGIAKTCSTNYWYKNVIFVGSHKFINKLFINLLSTNLLLNAVCWITARACVHAQTQMTPLAN